MLSRLNSALEALEVVVTAVETGGTTVTGQWPGPKQLSSSPTAFGIDGPEQVFGVVSVSRRRLLSRERRTSHQRAVLIKWRYLLQPRASRS